MPSCKGWGLSLSFDKGWGLSLSFGEAKNLVTRQVDASAKKVDTVDIHSFNNKFSTACGSAQRVDGSLYVVSFDAAT